MTGTVTALEAGIAAEVADIDLRALLDDQDVAIIERAFLHHPVSRTSDDGA